MKQINKQKKSLVTNKVNFVSIREQKQHQQLSKPTKQVTTNNTSKQPRAHKPLARQDQSTKEVKRVRLPLYHPSRFR